MYNINFDNNYNLINWSCLYWGIKKQLIMPESAVIYANKLSESNPDNVTPEIIELLIIDEINENDILCLIEKIFPDKKDLIDKKSYAIRTLRFLFLLEIKKNQQVIGIYWINWNSFMRTLIIPRIWMSLYHICQVKIVNMMFQITLRRKTSNIL